MEHIELEYRSEIDITKFEETVKAFDQKFQLISHTKRLTFMGFLSLEDSKINVRIRITNDLDKNKSETQIAIKKGAYHSHDRVELEQPIDKNQFMDFVKLFNLILPGEKIVLERETLNYKTTNEMVISVVKATKHAYIELEKQCDPSEKEKTSTEVLNTIKELGLTPLDEVASKSLFSKLDAEDDWKVVGTTEELLKVEQLYIQY